MPRREFAPCGQPGCDHPKEAHSEEGCQGTNLVWVRGEETETQCGCSGYVPWQGITVKTIMDMRARTWSELLGHASPLPDETEGRPYWRPSSLGYCLRRQVLWRRGVEETRVESPEAEADKEQRFSWGRRLEQMVADDIELSGLLITRQAHLEDPDLEVVGNADVVWGGMLTTTLPERSRYWDPDYTFAVQTLRARLLEKFEGETQVPVTGTEIKSTHSWAVRRSFNEGARIDYRVQSGCYLLIARRHPEQLPQPLERFQLVVVGRDAVRPLVYTTTTADMRLAEERLGTLNEHWRAGTLPECTCGTTPGIEWELKFCPYADPGDPSTCCSWTLLERLEASVRAAQ